MRSQCMLRPSAISFLSQSATLFSAWQATTQAPQPVQRSRSITIPHLYGLVIFSIMQNPFKPKAVSRDRRNRPELNEVTF